MLKNRLIFTLLYDNGNYMLSRNFRLQKAGDLDWLKEHYNFNSIAFSIDELVILDVSRENKNIDLFSSHIIKLTREYFLPIAAGGGIRTLKDGFKLMNSGADKVVVNTIIFDKPEIVGELAGTFGSQSVVASLDCSKNEKGYRVYKNNGSDDSGLSLKEVIKKIEKLGVGEIYLTSIDRDGTGQGYDLDLIEMVQALTTLPMIISGGVGKYNHFLEGMKKGNIKAAATANIYNFFANGLIKARQHLIDNSIDLATWDYSLEHLHNFFKRSKNNPT